MRKHQISPFLIIIAITTVVEGIGLLFLGSLIVNELDYFLPSFVYNSQLWIMVGSIAISTFLFVHAVGIIKGWKWIWWTSLVIWFVELGWILATIVISNTTGPEKELPFVFDYVGLGGPYMFGSLAVIHVLFIIYFLTKGAREWFDI